jgi:hypothetical protein
MDPTVVAAWIAAGVSVLTLAGTLVAQYLGYRATSRDAEETARAQSEQLDLTLAGQNQQLDRTLAEQRTRTLNERFATAAEQLGSDKPAVRLAGVYAMAGLADDWAENAQTCIDVLCAFLRLPSEPDPGQDAPEPRRLAFQAVQEVRHTVIRVIAAHLKKNATTRWQGLNFDFTGVVFDDGDFSDTLFSGGEVYFTDAQFPAGKVHFADAQFCAGRVYFGGARFSGGRVYFSDAQFSGGEVDFADAQFSGGTVSFGAARFSGGTVSFGGAQFSGGEVYFRTARFSGAAVDFRGARFSGGTVDFTEAHDWSVPPRFPWTQTPPPGVKLPEENQSVRS